MIIDIHTHLFSDEVCRDRNKYLDDSHFKHLYNSDKAQLLNYQGLIGAMDESGIDYAVALGFPWFDDRCCNEQNDYFSIIQKESGGRILPFGSVPLNLKNGFDSYVKGIHDRGLSGIGEISFYRDGMNSQNESYLRGILDAAGRYSLPVCIHVNEPVGHAYPGKYEPDLTRLYAIVSDSPETTIILAHWGGGLLFYELMPEVSKALKNCYYDIAASPYLYDNRIYEIAVEILGSEKILFGSDFPLIPFRRYIDTINSSVSDKMSIENILWRNAQAILGING